MVTTINYFTELLKLQNLLANGVQQAARQNQKVLVSYSLPVERLDPLELFARAEALGQSAFFWERSEDQFSLAGAGNACTLTGQNGARFEQAEQQWHVLLENALIHRQDIGGNLWGIGPSLMVGFAFDTAKKSSGRWHGYPDGLLRLPQVQIIARAEGCYLTLNALVEATTDPQTAAEHLAGFYSQLRHKQPSAVSRQPSASDLHPSSFILHPSTQLSLQDMRPADDWKALVGRAVQQIKAGAFQKVVLAREVHAQAEKTLNVPEVIGRLRINYPSATLFAISNEGRCFLGATPERLVRLYEGEVRTTGLAGSAPRGQTEEQDRELGLELLHSAKNLEEHAIVVRMLRTAMSKVCTYVWAEEAPRLLKLSNVQHLCTPVLGRLPDGAKISILKLVEQLHPTPALGGFPSREAMAWLRDNEGLDRGWYAAPVGWIDCQGEGEFVVAIRSALVEGSQAFLYAGCGIMADSDPQSEYDEASLKLKPMLTALGF
jgi:isochorismate synthase